MCGVLSVGEDIEEENCFVEDGLGNRREWSLLMRYGSGN